MGSNPRMESLGESAKVIPSAAAIIASGIVPVSVVSSIFNRPTNVEIGVMM